MARRSALILLLALLLAGCGSPAAPAGGGATALPSVSQATPAPEASTPAPTQPPDAGTPAQPADPRSQGNPDAPVTILIYSDFQCPFCARFARDTLPQIQEQYVKTGKVRLMFRDFPITSSHPSAMLAAVASRCAAAQGQFWPMHDQLFQTVGAVWGGQPAQDRQAMLKLAGDLKLDQQAFAGCLSDPSVEQAVADEASAGVDLHINATPSFFINQQTLRGAQSFEAFAQVIDQTLAGDTAAAPGDPAQPTPAPTAAPVPTALALPPVAADDPRALGDPKAPITILIYSDFECPYCSQFTRDTLEQLKSAYVGTGKARLVFRDFPLTSIHRSALVAAKAGRCAAAQGQFWPMHDRLFASHQEEWGGVPKRDAKVMREFAADLKLDQAAFASCMDDPALEQSIVAEAQAGQALGIGGTPSFFINGRPLVGAQPFEAFEEAIRRASGPYR